MFSSTFVLQSTSVTVAQTQVNQVALKLFKTPLTAALSSQE